MNKLFYFFLSVSLIGGVVSCKKETDVVTPDGPVNVPEQPRPRPSKAYPVGSPLGTVITATIGPAGGTLTSADERLTISVPAGAVDTPQPFGIQPISSTVPQALGAGFRLSPHGTTFKKPVTISVRYDPTDLPGTVAEVLALGYQTDKGVWKLAAKGKVDTAAHTVSVETTHFSDWTVLQRAVLLPEIAFVKPGGNLILQVSVLDDNVFVPMVTDTDVSEPYESPTQLVDVSTWKLAGSGKLTPAIWKASYDAPAALPTRNPVAVSIKLKGPTVIDGKPFRELWLVSTIYIGEEGLTYRINGGKWVHTISPQGARVLNTPAGRFLNIGTGATTDGNNLGVSIQSLQPPLETEETLDVTLKGMTMPWTLAASSPLFNLSDANANILYKHFYAVPPVFYPSPGALTFYHFGKAGDYIIGKFEMEKAGMYHPTKGYVGTARIEGHFRIKRAQ